MIHWNEEVRLIIADVDDTIAPVYHDIAREMVKEIEELLITGIKFFLISGQSIQNICARIIRYIHPELRNSILVAHCNGAEVYCFDREGKLCEKPVFTILDYVQVDKRKWKEVLQQIREHFGLEYIYTNKVDEFKAQVGDSPKAIMVEDRNVQISMDFVNGVGTTDVRFEIMEYAHKLLEEYGLKVVPHLGGDGAIDFNIEGVSKSRPIEEIISFSDKFDFNINGKIHMAHVDEVEIWGDNFSLSKGAADFAMCKGLPESVRTLCFRECQDYSKQYNICVWDGNRKLSEGVLEYLQSRKMKLIVL